MKNLSAGERSVIKATMLALLADRTNPKDFSQIQPKFSELLKTNFENRYIWLRFGLTISLTENSPHSALQAYNECMRIDQDDPLPAMLAAKISLEDLDDPEQGLILIDEAIKRCNHLLAKRRSESTNTIVECQPVLNNNNETLEDPGSANTSCNLTSPAQNAVSISTKSSQSSISHNNLQQQKHSSAENRVMISDCHYKDIKPLLSRCYLLASIMHAYIYEREPESIKQFKVDNMKSSLRFLDLVIEINPNDYLVYFHKGLHQVKQRNYPTAIDNLRRAIQLNPYHIPSMQLLILSLSALKFYEEALVLCESTLHEHKDNLFLLYIKCNLEQCLVESKGYKTALNTAQHMLRCLRRFEIVKDNNNNNNNNNNKTHSSNTTISAPTQSIQQQNNQQSLQSQQSQTNHQQQNHQTTSGSISNSTANNQLTSTNTTPIMMNLSNAAGDAKQSNNLFADDATQGMKQRSFLDGELSIWLLVAEIFVKIGSFEDAEMCVEEGAAYAKGPLCHQIMYMRGLIAKARNNLIEAKIFLQSCLALCPRHAKALQQVAHVHYLLGNHTTAEKFLRDSLDLDGDCFKTWHYLSLVLVELNQHDKASECAKKSTILEESAPAVAFSSISRLTLQ